MQNLRQVKFVWIENGASIDFGDSGLLGFYGGGTHKLVGFKPAPGRQLGGWLVFLMSGPRRQPHGRLPRRKKG